EGARLKEEITKAKEELEKEKAASFSMPPLQPEEETLEEIAQPKPEGGGFKRRKLSGPGAEEEEAARKARVAAKAAAAPKPEPEPAPKPEEPEEEEEPEPLAAKAAEVKALPAIVPATVPDVGWDEAVEAMNDRHAIIDNVGSKTVIASWEPSSLDPERL